MRARNYHYCIGKFGHKDYCEGSRLPLVRTPERAIPAITPIVISMFHLVLSRFGFRFCLARRFANSQALSGQISNVVPLSERHALTPSQPSRRWTPPPRQSAPIPCRPPRYPSSRTSSWLVPFPSGRSFRPCPSSLPAGRERFRGNPLSRERPGQAETERPPGSGMNPSRRSSSKERNRERARFRAPSGKIRVGLDLGSYVAVSSTPQTFLRGTRGLECPKACP